MSSSGSGILHTTEGIKIKAQIRIKLRLRPELLSFLSPGWNNDREHPNSRGSNDPGAGPWACWHSTVQHGLWLKSVSPQCWLPISHLCPSGAATFSPSPVGPWTVYPSGKAHSVIPPYRSHSTDLHTINKQINKPNKQTNKLKNSDLHCQETCSTLVRGDAHCATGPSLASLMTSLMTDPYILPGCWKSIPSSCSFDSFLLEFNMSSFWHSDNVADGEYAAVQPPHSKWVSPLLVAAGAVWRSQASWKNTPSHHISLCRYWKPASRSQHHPVSLPPPSQPAQAQGKVCAAHRFLSSVFLQGEREAFPSKHPTLHACLSAKKSSSWKGFLSLIVMAHRMGHSDAASAGSAELAGKPVRFNQEQASLHPLIQPCCGILCWVILHGSNNALRVFAFPLALEAGGTWHHTAAVCSRGSREVWVRGLGWNPLTCPVATVLPAQSVLEASVVPSLQAGNVSGPKVALRDRQDLHSCM